MRECVFKEEFLLLQNRRRGGGWLESACGPSCPHPHRGGGTDSGLCGRLCGSGTSGSLLLPSRRRGLANGEDSESPTLLVGHMGCGALPVSASPLPSAHPGLEVGLQQAVLLGAELAMRWARPRDASRGLAMPGLL